jgi:hypothetical protein
MSCGVNIIVGITLALAIAGSGRSALALGEHKGPSVKAQVLNVSNRYKPSSLKVKIRAGQFVAGDPKVKMYGRIRGNEVKVRGHVSFARDRIIVATHAGSTLTKLPSGERKIEIKAAQVPLPH